MYSSSTDASNTGGIYPGLAQYNTTSSSPPTAYPLPGPTSPFDMTFISQGYAYIPQHHLQPPSESQPAQHLSQPQPKSDVSKDYPAPVYTYSEDVDDYDGDGATWQMESLCIQEEDTASDEEIARKLQEDEYQLAAEEQRKRQAQRQQPARNGPAAKPGILGGLFGGGATAPKPVPMTNVPGVKRKPGPTVPPLSAAPLTPEERQPLLLQCKCSAVSGVQVLKGSCFLYRGLFRFASPLDHGRSLVVRLHLPTILSVSAVHGSTVTPGPPKIEKNSRSSPNVLQIFTNDGLVHTFFEFPNSKTFKRVTDILNSMVANNKKTQSAQAKTTQPATTMAVPPSPSVQIVQPHHAQQQPMPMMMYPFPMPQQGQVMQSMQPMAYPAYAYASMPVPQHPQGAYQVQVIPGPQGQPSPPVILQHSSSPTTQTTFVTLPPSAATPSTGIASTATSVAPYPASVTWSQQ